MQNESQKQAISRIIEAQLENDSGYFLVEVRISPGNNIKVFIDGDPGVTIEKCVSLNRALYNEFEETAFFPNGDFSLEVSSPGLDEPLKLLRQYKKNLGRKVEVILNDGTKWEGKLVEVNDENIVIEESKGRKKEMIQHNFSFENIKTTKIQIVF